MSDKDFEVAVNRFDAAARNCAGDTQASASGEVSDVASEYAAARTALFASRDTPKAPDKDFEAAVERLETATFTWARARAGTKQAHKWIDERDTARQALLTQYEARRVRQEWQPIETAPKDGTYVLGFGSHVSRGTYIDVTHFWGDRWTIVWMEGYGEPTHWMPLPAPPSPVAVEHVERGEVAKTIDDPRVPEYIILANARRICSRRFKKIPNWSLAMEIFGLGSTWAWALCERAGIDPDSTSTARSKESQS